MTTIVDYGLKFVGKQETQGSNRGPMLTKWGKEVLGGGWTGAPLSWCGIWAFAMLMEFNNLTRKQLLLQLGLEHLFPESADSWLSEGTRNNKLIETPTGICVGVWMKQDAKGNYSTTDAHHVIICRSAFTPKNDVTFATIEGNTTPVGEGLVSRNGDGVYAKSRVWHPGAWKFIQVDTALVDHNPTPQPKPQPAVVTTPTVTKLVEATEPKYKPAKNVSKDDARD